MQPETTQLGEPPLAAGLLPAHGQEALRHPRGPEGKGALVTRALQTAILDSANFSIIATDEKGVIQLFNVGAERMLGYVAADVVNKITPAEISDPQEVITRAKALSFELGTPITPGLAGPGLQGFPRERGHLRTDLHPQGRQPLPGRRVRHRAA